MSELRVRFEAAEGKGYLAQLSDPDGKPGVTVPFTHFLTEDDYEVGGLAWSATAGGSGIRGWSHSEDRPW